MQNGETNVDLYLGFMKEKKMYVSIHGEEGGGYPGVAYGLEGDNNLRKSPHFATEDRKLFLKNAIKVKILGSRGPRKSP